MKYTNHFSLKANWRKGCNIKPSSRSPIHHQSDHKTPKMIRTFLNDFFETTSDRYKRISKVV